MSRNNSTIHPATITNSPILWSYIVVHLKGLNILNITELKCFYAKFGNETSETNFPRLHTIIKLLP